MSTLPIAIHHAFLLPSLLRISAHFRIISFLHPMTPLTDLPSELLLIILEQLPDLYSLHSFSCISRRTAVVVNEYAAHLIQTILSKDFQPISQLARHVLDIYADPLPWSNFSEYAHFFTRGDHLPYSRVNNCRPLALRRLIATGYNIERLSHACVQVLFKRSMSITPLKPERGSCRIGWLDVDEWQPGHPYELEDGGPPSWLELQRVRRAMWALHLYYELCIAGSRAGWPESDVLALRSATAAQFWNHKNNWEIDEYICIEEVLSQLSTDTVDSLTIGVHPVQFAARALPDGILPFPIPVIWPMRPLSRLPEWHEEFSLTCPGTGWLFYKLYCTQTRSALRSTPFDFYRSLGFGIWLGNRLGYLGLAHFHFDDGLKKSRFPGTMGQVYYKWRSILPMSEYCKDEPPDLSNDHLSPWRRRILLDDDTMFGELASLVDL
ncbi:hypothetical protein K402DRAFT_394340 [Aulographum hederae CBS 113979]|uniref:F-box domain-containing protein n=1 Tax=Aulographum hederae CBS 113979 TaxID=1176131 RepID=A0A6G1GY34_9PEZI|nr:hypothetical protein K402DRAFT_394340 [Aulographum hederae CBS 113979]